MHPSRSEASKLDQFLMIWSRALFSLSMHICWSFGPVLCSPPTARLSITSAAFRQVSWMSMVGIWARAAPAKMVIAAANTNAEAAHREINPCATVVLSIVNSNWADKPQSTSC